MRKVGYYDLVVDCIEYIKEILYFQLHLYVDRIDSELLELLVYVFENQIGEVIIFHVFLRIL